MVTISGCSHLKLNLKAKIYIYVNSTTQRCPNKIIKIFQFEDFCHLPPVAATPVVHLELRISPRIFGKNSKRPYWYTQGLGGNWFMKKNRSRKSRGTVPLKGDLLNDRYTPLFSLVNTFKYTVKRVDEVVRHPHRGRRNNSAWCRKSFQQPWRQFYYKYQTFTTEFYMRRTSSL